MMRLIDADNIYNFGDFVILHEDGNAYVPLADLCKIIDIQPTVYDIDKVVEELRRMSGNGYRDVDGDYVPPMIETKNAIEIVKKGIRKDISE